MPVMHEDFIRCKCTNAEFEKKEIVTLPTGLRPRYKNELGVEHPALEKEIQYICTRCNRSLDI